MAKHINIETLKLYWASSKGYRKYLIIGFIAIPVAGLLLDTLLPYVLSMAISDLSTNSAKNLTTLLIAAGFIGFIGAITNLIGFQSLIEHEGRARSNNAVATLDKLLAKDVAWFANTKIGALTGRYIDFLNAQVGLQDLVIIRTLTFAINITVGSAIVFANSKLLGVIIIGFVIGIMLQVRFSLRLRRHLRDERKRLIGEVHGIAADSIANYSTVKAFAGEEFEINQTLEINEKYRKVCNRDFKWMVTEGSSRLFSMSAVQIISIAIIAGLLINNQIDLGIAIFVIAYLQRVASQLFVLGEIVNGYDKLFLQAAPITEMVIEPPVIQDVENAKKLVADGGKIEFQNVDFAYADAPDVDVLRDFNLVVKPGEKIGVVGASGAGKTTITKLLMRFNDTTNGQILIDDQDISRVTQKSLREAIALVPQEPMLFHRSIKENIIYGNQNASDEAISQAIISANAHEFIDKLPDKLETIVGERGIKLSGGQKQGVAIARAILKKASILILDEATSALDSESEKLIQSSLSNLMKNRTSIVIAHRLSTISKLDRIIVVENGEIVEDGPHQALIDKNGTYAKLWQHQSGGFIG